MIRRKDQPSFQMLSRRSRHAAIALQQKSWPASGEHARLACFDRRPRRSNAFPVAARAPTTARVGAAWARALPNPGLAAVTVFLDWL
jgi:hypothetical protein